MDDESPRIGKSRRGNAGKGRKPGSKNKIPSSVKEMILQALQNVGGAEYLERQAVENPSAFLSLLGKLIPQEIDASVEGTTYTGGIVAIPAKFQTVEEWRAAFHLDEPKEEIEGREL